MHDYTDGSVLVNLGGFQRHRPERPRDAVDSARSGAVQMDAPATAERVLGAINTASLPR